METIIDNLKGLRLSGMADSYEVRSKEATTNQLAFSEFLSLLIEDEILYRQQKQYERRYKKAEFRGSKTLDNFDFTANPKINQKLIRDLATCHYIKEGNPVIIEGPCGTGKSHIAQALGHCALKVGYDVMFTSQTKLTEMMQAAKALSNYHSILKKLSKIDLLIIDDFGLKPLRTPEDEYIHELIAERYEIKSTIITSNLSINEWHQAFPNKLLAVASVDRLIHNAYKITLTGKSYRSIKN